MSSRRLHQDKYIGPGHASSEDVFKTSSKCLDKGQNNCLGHSLQDVFNRFSKLPQYVFKISSRCLQDVL